MVLLNTVEMMDPITSAPELVPHLVRGGGWCSEGCGTWEELLPKFLKLLLKYFISKGAGGVDDASVVLLLYFLPLNLLFTICFFAFLIDELRPQLLCYSCRGR